VEKEEQADASQGWSSNWAGRMDFTADHYFRASVERMNQAHRLYREGEGYYALAMYTAGLAVECLLRAYMVKRKREFESRHDLLLLFKESGILGVNPDRLKTKDLTEEQIQSHQKTLKVAVNDVVILWRNNYRFASEARLLAYLKQKKLYRGTTGNLLKAKASDLLKADQRFIDKGVFQWR
jgi:hypothetical protein